MPKPSCSPATGKRNTASDGWKPEAVQGSPPTKVNTNALIGTANETGTLVDGNQCMALLDTGSQVSTVAEWFYNKYLSNKHVQLIENLLRVVGAGGQEVPFSGFIEVDVSFPHSDTGNDDTVVALVLIVQDNEYRSPWQRAYKAMSLQENFQDKDNYVKAITMHQITIGAYQTFV